MADVVLAIDPGRTKCGVAVVRRYPLPDCAAQDASCCRPGVSPFQTACCSVVDTDNLASAIRELAARHTPDVIIVGDGTTSSQAVQIAREAGVGPVEIVDEKFSTLLARKRFFQENPPRGLRRLIPTSMQTPCKPCDNYVAVILAEKYLAESQS